MEDQAKSLATEAADGGVCTSAKQTATSDGPCSSGGPVVTTRSRPVSFCGFDKATGPNGGLVVQSADPASSAAKAGIMVGDEILALNEVRVAEPAQAMAELQTAGVGASVTVTLVRGGARLSVPMIVHAKSLALDLDDLDEVVERKIAPAAS